jgi:hypothetical protein
VNGEQRRKELDPKRVLGLQLHVSHLTDPVNCLTTQATPILRGSQIRKSSSHVFKHMAGTYILQGISTERLIFPPPLKEYLRFHGMACLTGLPSIRPKGIAMLEDLHQLPRES